MRTSANSSHLAQPRRCQPRRASCHDHAIKPVAESNRIVWNVETIETALGWVGFVGFEGKLYTLAFGYDTRDQALEAAMRNPNALDAKTAITRSGRWHPTLARQLVDYADGQPENFENIELDWTFLSAFARRVILACRGVEWGETVSYGDLARRAGSPRAARAVGNIMASNRTPLIVPCHRVVTAHGKLGGFSAPQGVAMKLRLLALEGQPLPPVANR